MDERDEAEEKVQLRILSAQEKLQSNLYLFYQIYMNEEKKKSNLISFEHNFIEKQIFQKLFISLCSIAK